MSNPRSLADFTISRIAARSAFPDRAAVLSIRLVREFTPDIFSIITGPSWLTRISHSASYTVPRIDPAMLGGKIEDRVSVVTNALVASVREETDPVARKWALEDWG